MRAYWLPVCLGVVCLLTTAAGADKGFELSVGRTVLEPIQYKNLTLMPIVRSGKVKPGTDYMVLDEGMKKGVVKVIEKGEVNELVLVNNSDDPLFLMAGEVIIGGKQDRIIGKDTIISPKTRETVPAFCVEKGRWNGRKANFESAGALAHTKLRKQAKYKGQSEVWQEVESKNSKRKVANSTHTYRKVATGKKVAGSVANYQKAFARALAAHPRKNEVVGFVVVLNGKTAAIEQFGSPALYRKLSDKLLRSYFVEAVDAPIVSGAKPPAAAAVRKFASDAVKAKKASRKRVHTNAAADTYNYDSAELSGSTVKRKTSPKAAPAAAEEEAVYDSAYAN